MIPLIALGFTLSLDNFRTSVVLGGLKPTWRQSVRTSLIFAIWDGLAPIVGLLFGACIGEQISGPAELIGAAALAAYGLWVTIKAIVSVEHADLDLKVARRWLPLPLAIDNIAAGAVLGVAGYSPWLAPILFAVMTFVMSIAGHQVGRSVANFIPRIRTDLLTGISLLIMAGLLFLGVGGES